MMMMTVITSMKRSLFICFAFAFHLTTTISNAACATTVRNRANTNSLPMMVMSTLSPTLPERLG